MKERFRSWLACMAFLYPAFWGSVALFFAFLPLLRILFFHHRLSFLQIDHMICLVVSVPNDPSGYPNTESQIASPFWQTGPLVLLVVFLLEIASRKNRLLAGLSVAFLGLAGTLLPLTAIFAKRALSARPVAECLFFGGISCLGLRWMQAAWGSARYWERAGMLLASFNLPLAAPILLAAVISRTTGMWLIWPTVPPAIVSLLVCIPAVTREPSRSTSVDWKTVLTGVAPTLSLIAGISVAGPMLTRHFKRQELEVARSATASLPKIPVDLPYPKLFFQKGVNYAAEFPGVYTSEAARERLKLLPRYGINAVALVPYGGASRRAPEVRLFTEDASWESDEGIEQLSRVAHFAGMYVLLKPQLHAGGHVTELDFSAPRDRAKWFTDYQNFIEHYAQLAVRIHADVLCVGVELAKMAKYDAEWKNLIARVRVIYPGPLVYAANFGEDFEGVTSWDALDYIGLDNYYPLPDDYSTEEIVQKVAAIQGKYQRPVSFTEAGFASVEGTHRRPWEDARGKFSMEEQARCYDAIFRAFYNKSWFQGVYWWRVGTNFSAGPEDASHTPWGKPAMEVIRRWYLQGGR